MTAEIINLRRARRAKARAEREREAAQNRAVHGRRRSERIKAKAERETETRRLDGHRRDPD